MPPSIFSTSFFSRLANFEKSEELPSELQRGPRDAREKRPYPYPGGGGYTYWPGGWAEGEAVLEPSPTKVMDSSQFDAEYSQFIAAHVVLHECCSHHGTRRRATTDLIIANDTNITDFVKFDAECKNVVLLAESCRRLLATSSMSDNIMIERPSKMIGNGQTPSSSVLLDVKGYFFKMGRKRGPSGGGFSRNRRKGPIGVAADGAGGLKRPGAARNRKGAQKGPGMRSFKRACLK